MANVNEQLYGPVADSAAQKYNVPQSLFRSLISSESSFDPYAYNKSGASGIAQFMPATASDKGIDPWNPYQSLDAAASYISTLYDKAGNWQDAISMYKGYSNVADGFSTAQKVIENAMSFVGGPERAMMNDIYNGKSVEDAAKAATSKLNPTATDSKPLYQWGFQDFKDALANSAYGFMIGFVGVVFIIGSIWVLINKRQGV